MHILCVCAPSHGLPHEHAEWRARVVLPPLMGRSAACALHVRALLVLLHLIASELCVLSTACLSFVATGNSTTTIPPSLGFLRTMTYLCVCAPSHGLPHEHAEWRVRVVLPPLMPRLTGRCAACALHVRALLVLLHLIASELCVLSAACLLFVATGDSPTTCSREASPPEWAP
jgi:hypothetical protein